MSKQKMYIVGAEDDDVDGRPLRSEHRAETEALKDLANRIAKLSQGQRRLLPLSEEAQEQLDLLARSGNTPDRRRTLKRAQLFLAQADIAAVEAAIEGKGATTISLPEAEAWRSRFLTGDDEAIQKFLLIYPAGDRQLLRGAVREAQGEGPLAKKSSQRLFKLIREAMEAGAVDEVKD